MNMHYTWHDDEIQEGVKREEEGLMYQIRMREGCRNGIKFHSLLNLLRNV